MGFWSKLTGLDAIEKVGDAAGSLMDRFGFTKKLSEAEKIDKWVQVIQATTASDKLDNEDLNSTREMAMVQMRTQPASWVVRNLNGALRPFAGYVAVLAVTNKFWGQFLSQIIDDFSWSPIGFSTEEYAILGVIIAFFFAGRQRSKEKMVSIIS